MKRPGLILLLCVLSPIQLSGCSSEDPVQGWGTVAIILDRNQCNRDEMPVLERTATVSGTVFEGDVTLFSTESKCFRGHFNGGTGRGWRREKPCSHFSPRRRAVQT